MTMNRWIESSQRVYRLLLRLYPQAYRADYEMEMFRVFTDQCRDVYRAARPGSAFCRCGRARWSTWA